MTEHISRDEFLRRYRQTPPEHPGPRKPWSAAKPTDCPQGHRHASKLEARVCGRLTLLCEHHGYILYQQVRLPLWSLAPNPKGRPMTITIDFAIVERGQLIRLIDAKGRKSRDWDRGAKAAEAAYGIEVEEVSE